MANEKVFIVEDEQDILELVKFNLLKSSYIVQSAMNGIDALKKILTFEPNLVLLDIMLPDIDGLEILKNLKSDPQTAAIKIIMLTARGEEEDIIRGLELGADDYITKPFSPRVLLARIKTVLRRISVKAESSSGSLKIKNITIDPGRFEVRINNEPVTLTKTEFNLLHFLAQRPGWVFTRNQIIDGVQGEDYPVTDRSVDVQIVGLRKKMGDAGDYIETVRGVGYRFKDSE